MATLEELYCCVDDFCQKFVPFWHQQLIGDGLLQRNRSSSLSFREVMTILILFHMSHYRDFKFFYTKHVTPYLHKEFPSLVGYTRILILKRRALFLCALFQYPDYRCIFLQIRQLAAD